MDITHWNYRVIRKEIALEEYEYGIYEVYYNSNGDMLCWSELPDHPYGESFLELQNDMNGFKKATQKPILEEKEIDGELKLVEIENVRV